MKNMLNGLRLAACGLLLIASGANAVPVTWTVTSNTGGNFSLSGSFVYDADTTSFSSISISLNSATLNTAGSGSTGTRFILSNGTSSSSDAVDFYNPSPALGNSGGTVTVNITAAGTCGASNCALPSTINNTLGVDSVVLTGVVTPAPSAVPTLSEWSQLLLALMTIMVVGWHFHRERSY